MPSRVPPRPTRAGRTRRATRPRSGSHCRGPPRRGTARPRRSWLRPPCEIPRPGTGPRVEDVRGRRSRPAGEAVAGVEGHEEDGRAGDAAARPDRRRSRRRRRPWGARCAARAGARGPLRGGSASTLLAGSAPREDHEEVAATAARTRSQDGEELQEASHRGYPASHSVRCHAPCHRRDVHPTARRVRPASRAARQVSRRRHRSPRGGRSPRPRGAWRTR